MQSKNSFDVLKVRERLEENLSSAQISDCLDDLIFHAIKPLLLNTHHVEQSLAEMLPFTASNARRKLSNLTQPLLVDGLFSVISSRSKLAKFKLLRKLRLERTIHYDYISSFQQLAKAHAQAEQQFMTLPRTDKAGRFNAKRIMHQIEEYIGLKAGCSMHSLSAQVTYWLDQALDFRGMVAEKFIRLAYTDSAKAMSQTGLNIVQDDLFDDYMVATFKAIDKFNPDKGALTSYIRWWFMDAKTPYHNGHEYGVAFYMPTMQRKKLLESGSMNGSNLAGTIDAEDAAQAVDPTGDVLNNIIDTESNTHQIRLAAQADSGKLAALVSQITYPLNPEEISLLRSQR